MMEYKCFLNKENKKVSYPNLTIIEPLFFQKIQPLSLITNELCAGDIILIEFKNNKVSRVYKTNDLNIEQIYGEQLDDNKIVNTQLFCWNKKEAICKYIKSLMSEFSLQDLIYNRHDLNIFEKEFTKYLLNCKNVDKFNLRHCRSLVFKTCKDVKLVEKIYLFIKNNPFDYFIHDFSDIQFNFDQWIVQINYEC